MVESPMNDALLSKGWRRRVPAGRSGRLNELNDAGIVGRGKVSNTEYSIKIEHLLQASECCVRERRLRRES